MKSRDIKYTYEDVQKSISIDIAICENIHRKHMYIQKPCKHIISSVTTLSLLFLPLCKWHVSPSRHDMSY